MSGFDTTLVAYHVRRLDDDGLAALVADLWSVRGYETATEGGDIVARHGTEAVRIRSGSGADPSSEVPPDVIVTTGGRGQRQDPAHSHGDARVVDGTALAEMLGYAIDRSVARELCERHLGGKPESLAPPPGRRLRRRTGTVLGSAPTLALLVGALAIAVLLASVAGFPSVDASADTPADGESGTVAEKTPSTDDSVSAAEPAGSSRDGRATEGFPPGVTAAGITDVEALARAHERAVGNRSHTVWVDWYRPQRMRPNGTLRHRDIDITTEKDRFLIRTSIEQSANRTHREAIYHDGSAIYAAGWNDTTERYDQPLRITPRQVTVATPASVRARIVRQYLSTPETSIAGVVERDGTQLYRIRGQGRPNVSWTVAIIDYEVEALLDSQGFVHDISIRANVSYPQVADNSTIPIERTVTYGRMNTTTVDPPAWYENHTRGE